MVDEFGHIPDVGASLSQVEYDSFTGHSFNDQARGDIAISNTAATGLIRLGKGAQNTLLGMNADDPEWQSNIDVVGTLDVTGVATFDNDVRVASDIGVGADTDLLQLASAQLTVNGDIVVTGTVDGVDIAARDHAVVTTILELDTDTTGAELTELADASETALHSHAAGAASAWEHIDTQVLGGTAASVSFANLNSEFRSFRLTAYIIATAALDVLLRHNNISAATYDHQSLIAQSTTVAGLRVLDTTEILLTVDPIGTGLAGAFEILVTKSVAAAKMIALSQGVVEVSSGGAQELVMVTGTENNVADLIDRIDLIASTSTFAANSRFVLEGNRSA